MQRKKKKKKSKAVILSHHKPPVTNHQSAEAISSSSRRHKPPPDIIHNRHRLAVEKGKERVDMKDCACVVLVPSVPIGNYMVYLIDIVTQKLRGIINFNNYPCMMGFVVYKCMLYMFGGVNYDNFADLVGLCDAYQFDLHQLAKTYGCTNDEHKPLPMKLPQMNYGKSNPAVLLVGNKICVFDEFLGLNPKDSHFEVYDPKEKSWTRIQDPFHVEGKFSVEVHFVKDDKLFLYIRNKPGVYVLDFGTASLTWTHIKVNCPFLHDMFYSCGVFHHIRGVNIGSLRVGVREAFFICKKGCITRWVDHVVCTGTTAGERYDCCHQGHGEIFRLDSGNKVCAIYPTLVQKLPRHKPKVARFDVRKSMFAQQPVIRKRGCQIKSRRRLLVNECSVDTNASPITMEVLKSFTVPMCYDDDREGLGFITTVSLCNP